LNKNKKINDILKFLSVSQLKFDLHIKKYHIINFLNKINILQEIPYSIDKNLLCDHLEKYNIYDLYNSISKDIKISLDINYNDYIEKDLYNRLCNNNKKFNSDVHYRKEYMDQLTKQIESLIYSNHIIKNELKIKQIKILKIVDILSLVFYSLIQQKDKVYHYKQIDTRGRLYHNGPNSFISDKILRSILIVVDDDKKKAPLR
jgi:hypothetical protein